MTDKRKEVFLEGSNCRHHIVGDIDWVDARVAFYVSHGEWVVEERIIDD